MDTRKRISTPPPGPPSVPIPRPARAVSQAILDDLMSREDNIRRPPVMAADLLAIIVELHRKQRPFPSREDMARALQCSVFGIDGAIATAELRGYITEHRDIVEGNTSRRMGVVRLKRYIPSKRLLELADGAVRKRA